MSWVDPKSVGAFSLWYRVMFRVRALFVRKQGSQS